MAVHDAKQFEAARHQLHSAVQWLARIERSYGSQNGGGERVTLRWQAARSAITTGPLEGNLTLELRLPEIILQFREDGEMSNHPFDVAEHSPAHIEAWLLVELLHRGIDRTRFSKALPYDVSGLLSGDGVEFSPKAYEKELGALTLWFSRAASALAEASDRSGVDQKQAVTVQPDDLSLEAAKNTTHIIGFKASGKRVSEPFFYIRRRDRSDEAAAGPGEDVLPVSQIAAQGDGTRVVAQFLTGT
jgi:hypothetical protein